MQETSIRSWSDLAANIEHWVFERCLFRGETQADNALMPRIGRRETWAEDGYSPELERAAFRRFKMQATPYLEQPPATDTEWLMLAQHHGLPTRLLDWTQSPLAAAFFAVEASGEFGPAALYVVPWRAALEGFAGDPFAVNEVMYLVLSHFSPRIVAQQGVFSLHPRPDQPYAPDGLIKAVIPADVSLRLKRLLWQFGISRAALFRTLDDVSQDLAWMLRWNPDLEAIGTGA
jgi:hypothetical protein